MSILEARGGIPRVLRATIDNTTGRKWRLPTNIKYLIVRVSSNPCKLYFTEEDWLADSNYVLIPVAAATTPYGEWQGPVEAENLWFKGSGGSSNIEAVGFQRRA